MNKRTLAGALAIAGVTIGLLTAPIAAGEPAPLKEACKNAGYQAPPGALANQGQCIKAANQASRESGDRSGTAVCSPCSFSVFGFEPQPIAAQAR